ncbi:Predicted amidohydrolase [Friedmanniella luteola]|uniref:Predicted amidohydrolase n=1 Tax=Friedmanniella luteola TaxID=546871 RepID=A0A1H1NPJ4_9ACTN|nr:carbon-nitrogen hydrolase family protein [Friedmanniella luteola]SDS00877.1 Predicted amidohydrolase [Friedmanniella luteola]
MRIALAQIVSGPDPAANLAQLTRRTREAAGAGAELVLFPEATMRAFGGGDLAAVAEPLDGPWASAVREAATEAGVVVAAGMFTPAGGGRVTNTLLVTGPGVEASYTKIHLFDAFGFAESDTVAAGEEPLVVEVAGVGVGFTTCYDVRFPGLYTTLAERGATVVAVCASWGAGPGKVEQWELLVRARALDATVFVAACGQADPSTTGVAPAGSAPTGVGHSLVVGPTGTVLAGLGAEPGLLLADVDPAELAAVRQALPVLANRRF